MLAQGIHTGVHDQGSLHTDLNFLDFKQAALRKKRGMTGMMMMMMMMPGFFVFSEFYFSAETEELRVVRIETS